MDDELCVGRICSRLSSGSGVIEYAYWSDGGGRCLSVHGDSTSGSSDCGEYFWSDRKESDSGSDCYDGGYVWGINRVSCTGGRSSDLVYGDEYAELLYAAHAERYGNGVY